MSEGCRSTCPSISAKAQAAQPSPLESESARALPPNLHSFRSSDSLPPRHRSPPPRRRRQPRLCPRPRPRASAMLAASLRPGPSLAAFPASARTSPIAFLPFPARLHHRPLLLSATAEGTGAPAGQGDASAAPVDEVRLPQVCFLGVAILFSPAGFWSARLGSAAAR